MLPYPHITQGAWGRLPGTSAVLDFTIDRQNLMRATEQRLAACTWILDEIAHRSAVQRYDHVNLLGVYWMFESVHRGWNVDDHWLLKSLRPRIHRYGLKFLWIPFWSTYNVHLLDDYQSYYFDLAFLQPNYMFYKEGKSLQAAAEAARQRGTGLEMEYYLELGEPIGVTGERHSRFRDYLNGGVTYGYMREAACAHFQGVGALERMRAHEDPVEREFYEDIYRFVKGDYVLKPAIPRNAEAVVPGRVAIAIDLGGTQLRGALVDASGQVLAKRAVPTPRGRAAILAGIEEMATWARSEAAASHVDPVGIGVSTGGRVDSLRGVVVDATALLDAWTDVPLAAQLGASTGLRVQVDNDGHCAALAERRFGAGRDVRHFVTIVVGTGIGGGIVCDGELLRGGRNAAGELGHVPVHADGPACSCGSRGCVERYASGSGLAERASALPEAVRRRAFGDAVGGLTGEMVGRAALSGQPEALAVVREGGAALGAALGGLLNVLNPQRVILAGPVLALGEAYLDPLRAAVEQHAMKTARESCEVVLSSLDEPALLGAAALVLPA